jgi:hypothetical protein
MKHHQFINNKTNNMMQQQRITLPTIKRLNKSLINTCAKLICISLLLTTQTAHADFRKALTAYQNRDGKTMLAEVQDAVNKKSDDGLVLFLSNLHFDNVLTTSTLYVGENEKKTIYPPTKMNKPNTTLEKLLTPSQAESLFQKLNDVAQLSTLDAQYEYLLLRYGDFYPNYLYIEPDDTREGMIKNREQFKKVQIDEMTLLANRGYGKAAYYLYCLFKYNGTNNINESEQASYWLKKAKKNGYSLEFNEELNEFLPKTTKRQKNQPVISVYRYDNFEKTNFIQTNYFLDVYEGGEVNFTKGSLIDIPIYKKNIIKKISKLEVNKLVSSIKKFGFQNQNIITTNVKNLDPTWAGQTFGDISIRATYFVTLNDKKKSRTIVFKIAEEESDVPIFLGKTLNLINSQVPTQLYRCGVALDRDYYQHCVNQDLKYQSINKGE